MIIQITVENRYITTPLATIKELIMHLQTKNQTLQEQMAQEQARVRKIGYSNDNITHVAVPSPDSGRALELDAPYGFILITVDLC